MQRIKAKKLLAAVLLVDVYVLGIALIVHAIGIQVDFEDEGFSDKHPPQNGYQ